MKKPITGVVILILLTVVFCGIDKTRELICNIINGLVNFFEQFFLTVKPLIPVMGIKEFVVSIVLIGLVVGVSFLIGCKLTKKDKRKVKRAIKDGVEIASTISELTSAIKGK